ncbi:helix-turn-helix domain-containing protein [Sinorhizobium medicae]|uniref:Putative transcriptional regulator, Crp/Fnr family n=1 Tax=Sinorhizobium medicae (strain WSM419) TaxID=366394 RepID=A6UMJ4_SINMW|nr:Crp/Fnr family transcriptional regulator [Sinorhizobium medicae]ABR64874.1 putative transcriptional regulator, Crp/Fnr family [Sinorhizobium medicae WSM419]MBO1945161.1 Crp/Fnr family transcriptional regulator [Sinorhizobium medicae]MDX0412037.1 helix-turn-helix domain-containing protein [Sinorhizobium medicae]MDX0423992.1 helix-turn-helix domain-containing protein [Sinorhizobium medicae]MDX0431421.1 helix-turn-helix domain-containing protein [Sinorhizobium medicae]
MKIDRSVIRSLALFARMSDADLDRLLNHATARRVPQGDAVFEQGQTATSFFLLLHGRLKVTQVTEDGQQIIVRVVHPGDLFGFARALQRSDYPGTATAATESLALSWPTDLWPQFVEQNPHLAVSTMQTIGQRLEEAHTRIREMSTQEVERRVAHAVLRLSRQAGKQEKGGVRIDFPISRQDIAEMTGTTLHTVSRILSAWEQKGLVEGGRQKLIICDLPGLAALAEGGRD